MKNILLMAGSGVIAVLAIYLISPDTTSNESALNLDKKPEFFMTDFTAYYTDKNGRIDKKVTGDKIDIYDKKDYSFIRSPTVTLTKKDGFKFVLQAANAQKFSEDKILLSGDVFATNYLSGFTETMRTPEIWLYPHIKYAETDKKVSISRATSTTRSTGAKFHFNINKLELLSDTTTIFNIE